MRENDIGDVLISDQDPMCGVLTDRDIVIRALAEGRDPASTMAGEIASSNLVTVSPDDPVDRAVELMPAHAVRRLPVCHDGRPVGIVSIGDLAIEQDPRSALADISAACGQPLTLWTGADRAIAGTGTTSTASGSPTVRFRPAAGSLASTLPFRGR